MYGRGGKRGGSRWSGGYGRRGWERRVKGGGFMVCGCLFGWRERERERVRVDKFHHCVIMNLGSPGVGSGGGGKLGLLWGFSVAGSDPILPRRPAGRGGAWFDLLRISSSPPDPKASMYMYMRNFARERVICTICTITCNYAIENPPPLKI